MKCGSGRGIHFEDVLCEWPLRRIHFATGRATQNSGTWPKSVGRSVQEGERDPMSQQSQHWCLSEATKRSRLDSTRGGGCSVAFR